MEMGRLIDEDVLIGSIPDLNAFEEEDFCTSDMIHLIEDTPTIEAIPKDQYEARLKADMVAMLTEIQLEIEELDTPNNGSAYMDCVEIIQQKIDALKGENT
jgi:FtsZ-binding cell division protein ZapB